MKRCFLLVFLALSFLASAQTQQGYVKTKGRMDAQGNLIPGQGLKGATVSVQGLTAVLVNSDNGDFSFPVSNGQFRLESVNKKGYQLVDMDACPRNYNYSGNPLYIVMETPDQQLQDKLTAERKIRRNLQRQLQEREDEIETLKANQKITDEEYRQALQKLYSDQESNEQLISDMAKRYSELDYDQLDEFYRQVSYCIENGELVRADSLLNTKGDVTQQVEEQLRKGQAIKEKEEQLGKAKAAHAADREELAKRCYSYFEAFAAQHLNDTAAYYLELRASLDSANVDWQLTAAEFFMEYVGDYDKSFEIYQRAYRTIMQRPDTYQVELFKLYNNMGIYYYYIGDIDLAKTNLLKGIGIMKQMRGENASDLSSSYENLSVIYDDEGTSDSAVFYAEKARSVEAASFGKESPGMASILHNLGMNYMHYAMAEDTEEYYDKALEYYQEALRIARLNFGEESSTVSNIYNSMSALYDYRKDYRKALEYAQKDVEITKAIYGEHHPLVAESYNGMGLTCYYLGDYERAAACYYKSLTMMKRYFANEQTSKYEVYVNLGSLHLKQQEYDSSAYYYSSFINAYEKIYGKHRDIALVYGKLANVYIEQKDYPEAIRLLLIAANMEEELGGSNKVYLATYYLNIGVLYGKMEQYDKSLPYLENAYRIRKEVYGEEDERAVNLLERINTTKEEIKKQKK